MPLHTTGNETVSPEARVRVSLLASGKQSLLPHTRLPAESRRISSCRPLSRARTHGTAEVFCTTSSKVGLLPGAAVAGADTVTASMSSVQGPPGAGPAGAVVVAAADCGGGGVAMPDTDGTTRSRAGTLAGVREEPVEAAADALAPSPRARSVNPSQPTPPRTASNTARTSSRPRQQTPADRSPTGWSTPGTVVPARTGHRLGTPLPRDGTLGTH